MKVIIEAVSYTPDREPVNIHYAGYLVRTGPFARSMICSTTQSKLAARSPAAIQAIAPGYWSDEELKAELLAHLEELGFPVELVVNSNPS